MMMDFFNTSSKVLKAYTVSENTTGKRRKNAMKCFIRDLNGKIQPSFFLKWLFLFNETSQSTYNPRKAVHALK
jgi:hypothetical protein